MTSTTVELDRASKSYSGVKALDDVSISLGPGVTGLLGPNGAGKTTMLRMIATVLAPDRGRLRILGEDPSRLPGRLSIRRRLGYFPQEPGWYQNLSAFDFVDYVAILKEHADRDARQAEVRRVLHLVDLGDIMHKKIKSLSGGMRRRVILAQAILGQPELLVLDEPTVGLDPEQRLRFRELVSRIAEDHTVLLSTHQTEDVAALCQRVVVMDRGRISFDGTTIALAQLARGRVWTAASADSTARVSWRTANGEHRLIGDPPGGATLLEPTVEDGYLLLRGRGSDDRKG